MPGMLDDGAVDVDADARSASPRRCPKPFDGKSAKACGARECAAATVRSACSPWARWPPTAYEALELMGDDASRVTLYDVRVLPPDPAMIDDALNHERVITRRRRHPPRRRGHLDGLGGAQSRPGPRSPFPTTRILGVPRAYLEHHRPDALLAEIRPRPRRTRRRLRATARRRAGVRARPPESPAPDYFEYAGRPDRSPPYIEPMTFDVEKTDERVARRACRPSATPCCAKPRPRHPSPVRCSTSTTEGVFTLRRLRPAPLHERAEIRLGLRLAEFRRLRTGHDHRTSGPITLSRAHRDPLLEVRRTPRSRLHRRTDVDGTSLLRQLPRHRLRRSGRD